MADNHEYVDLGLSVKWAKCNIGADSPEEYGDYYAWGETETKESYSRLTYKFGKDEPFTKYQLRQRRFFFLPAKGDDKILLDPCDDVAQVRLGGAWRMPTINECKELKTECLWTWTSIEGISGYKVQSLKPGYTDNWIFLPAAGFHDGDSKDNVGTHGYYWSASGNKFYSDYARYFTFSESKVSTYKLHRYYGRSVRPVYDK